MFFFFLYGKHCKLFQKGAKKVISIIIIVVGGGGLLKSPASVSPVSPLHSKGPPCDVGRYIQHDLRGSEHVKKEATNETQHRFSNLM